MKSLKRLGVDPLAVYGTLCVKCPVGDAALADPACVARVAEEIAIVQPRIIVVMGEDALGVLNDLELPLARPVDLGARRDPAPHPVDRRARHARTSTSRSTRRTPSAPSGRRSARSATGGATCRLPRHRPRRRSARSADRWVSGSPACARVAAGVALNPWASRNAHWRRWATAARSAAPQLTREELEGILEAGGPGALRGPRRRARARRRRRRAGRRRLSRQSSRTILPSLPPAAKRS